MSEFRKNPFTGEWTLYAENRKNRPYEFVHHTRTKQSGGENCPFCGGHEAATTAAVYQDAPDDAWQIRVFPNMFPAVGADCPEAPADPFYDRAAGRGYHEVLVDTRAHGETIDGFSAARIEQVLAALQARVRAFREKEAVQYVQIFKNCGASAGMSIRHSHWQLIGLPLVPRRVAHMAETMAGDCLFCKMLAHEQEQGERIAAETAHFLAITPYASRFPYEVWIAPRTHLENFADLGEAARRELAEILRDTLRRVTLLQEEIGYNICVMDAPKGTPFHWHIEIYPRIGGFAGFEYATDCFINMVTPERAAAHYRGMETE